MNWLIFALIGHTFWTLCILLNKVLITKYFNNILVYAAFVGLVNAIPWLYIPFKPIAIPDVSWLIITLFTGFIYPYALIPYLKALAIEEVSRVAPLWRVSPLFTFIFALIFLGEQLSYYELIAFFLLLWGGFLLSVRQIKDTIKISDAFYLMLLASFFFAIYHTMVKYVYEHLNYYDGFMLIRLGAVCGGLMLLSIKRLRMEGFAIFSQMPASIKVVVLIYGISNVIWHVFLNFAISIAPVSLVSASAGFQPIMILLMTWVLSTFYPNVLQEDFTGKVLIQKLVAILLLIMGASLIILF